MIRTSVRGWLVLGALALAAAPASAEPATRRVSVMQPDSAFATVPHASISNVLYLERCVGGCTIHRGGVNDARTNTSTIPQGSGSTFTVDEFKNAARQAGGAADADWNALKQCVTEVYSPFNVVVTDVKPSSGLSFHEEVVAGLPTNIGLSNAILGIAPASCTPQDNAISFSFANAHPSANYVDELCATVAQESAHSFGLPNHEWAFPDGTSACRDPMSYRVDCGGEKFFRNEPATCGDNSENAPACQCGTTQNSHERLLGVFGPGTPITGKPTSTITLPLPMTKLGAVVAAQAGSQRGVGKVELYINGFKWAEQGGAAWGNKGQPNPSQYVITIPNGVPDSIVDLVVRAYDDLGASTDSATVTVFKGTNPAGCATADTCATGQKCEQGRCFWEPPTGELGDACTYGQFCKSGVCNGPSGDLICTQSCVPGADESCPADSGLSCQETSPHHGVCVIDSGGGGCCSAGDDGRAAWAPGALGALLSGLVILRRRSR